MPARNRKGVDVILTSEDDLGRQTPTARFDANLEALRTLKRIQAEAPRKATPAEQLVMARYAGFGDSAFGPAFAPLPVDSPNRHGNGAALSSRNSSARKITSASNDPG